MSPLIVAGLVLMAAPFVIGLIATLILLVLERAYRDAFLLASILSFSLGAFLLLAGEALMRTA